MAFILVENGIVVQKQPHPADGFIEAPDSVVCGQIDQGGGVYADPPPSVEQILKPYETAVQAHMDASARAAGYDDIKTAVTYADEPAVEKFQQEGQAFRAWRSLCWAYCYEQLAAVQADQRPQPTVEELIGELPALVLPQV